MKRPRPTVRLRLTLTYSALFLVAGAALLGISYFLVSNRESSGASATAITCAKLEQLAPAAPSANAGVEPRSGQLTGQCVHFDKNLTANPPPKMLMTPVNGGQASAAFAFARPFVVSAQSHVRGDVLVFSGLALGIMAVASVGLGWVVAGRVLRPLHRITDAARRASEETLGDRIALAGPNDELKELADTFDGMLGRLQGAFESQRQFVANASHELRTPLATERVLIDEALANTDASPEELREILEELRANGAEAERLADALLVLARSQRAALQRTRLDLAALAGEVVTSAQRRAAAAGVELRPRLEAAGVNGDAGLLERLVSNLVDNAIRHNEPGGWAEVVTGRDDRGAYLRVANSGAVIDDAVLPGLLAPFRRGEADRRSVAGGHGLGLSIVDAVVTAHGGTLALSAPTAGGLEVVVRL